MDNNKNATAALLEIDHHLWDDLPLQTIFQLLGVDVIHLLETVSICVKVAEAAALCTEKTLWGEEDRGGKQGRVAFKAKKVFHHLKSPREKTRPKLCTVLYEPNTGVFFD